MGSGIKSVSCVDSQVLLVFWEVVRQQGEERIGEAVLHRRGEVQNVKIRKFITGQTHKIICKKRQSV